MAVVVRPVVGGVTAVVGDVAVHVLVFADCAAELVVETSAAEVRVCVLADWVDGKVFGVEAVVGGGILGKS